MAVKNFIMIMTIHHYNYGKHFYDDDYTPL